MRRIGVLMYLAADDAEGTRLVAVLSITGFRYLNPVLAVCNPNPILQSGVLDSMGAISRLCHFAQRCDSDGLPPLGYASGEAFNYPQFLLPRGHPTLYRSSGTIR